MVILDPLVVALAIFKSFANFKSGSYFLNTKLIITKNKSF